MLRHLPSSCLRGLSRFLLWRWRKRIPKLWTRKCIVFLKLKYWAPPKVWLFCVKSSSIIHYSSKATTKYSYHVMWSVSLPVSESGLCPSKRVKTNADVPVEIPNPRLVLKMASWHGTIDTLKRFLWHFVPRSLDCDVKKSDQCYHKRSSHRKGLSARCKKSMSLRVLV